MTEILNRIRHEPALVIGAVQAGLALVLAFGVQLNTEQTGAILAVAAAVLAFIVRQRVGPIGDVDPDYVTKADE